MSSPEYEFGVPGTFQNSGMLHLAGLDGIDPAIDYPVAPGFDPSDLDTPSEETQLQIEKALPQWGPPFVKFVDERLSALEKAVEEAILKWSFQTRTDYFVSSAQTDGSGNIADQTCFIYKPPPGFTLALHRLVILADGSNAGTPFTAAGGYWEIRVGGEAISFGSLVSGAGSLPVEKTWGTRDAPRIRDGEVATFFMSAGPISKRITLKGQGSLDRTVEG